RRHTVGFLLWRGREASILRGQGVKTGGPARALTEPITNIVPGEPVGEGRPRMTRRGLAHTPAATRKDEAHARMAAQLAMDGRPPIEAPVRIEVMVELPIPASWSERKKAEAITGTVRPTSRPDVDNYVKAILDAINTIVVADDSQIVELQAAK